MKIDKVRCPLKDECGATMCDYEYRERECSYYYSNARPGAELEAKKENYENLKTEHLDLIRTLKHYKSEAYKEFAERLKAKAEIIAGGDYGFTYEIGEDDIDGILTELTERKEDEGE